MSEEVIEIEILGWEKFQHHNGKKTYGWFKMSSVILLDHEMRMLTPSEFKVWVYFMCSCAQVRQSEIKVGVKFAGSSLGVHPKSVRSAIIKLESFQIVRVVSGTLCVPQKRIEENRIEKKRKEEKKEPPSVGEVLKKEKPLKSVSSKPSTSDFIVTFVKSFQRRYGKTSRPDLSGKVLGQIKTVVKDQGVERSCLLIQVYLQMEDPWFLTKCHDFSTFVANLQKISLALDTGLQDPNSPLARLGREIEREEEHAQLPGI